jgi:MFS family permease
VRSNPRRLVALSALHYALFPIPVVTLFWTEQIGMSLTDVMTLQAAFSVSVVLCELPSGYLADRIGYRASLLIGGIAWVAGWLVYAWAASFGTVVCAETLLGAAAAFMSGADRALLWVSLEASGRSGQYTRWEGRLRAAGQVSEAVTSAAGGWLYTIRPRLPFWLQIPLAGVGLASIVALREVPGLPPRRAIARTSRAPGTCCEALCGIDVACARRWRWPSPSACRAS